MPVTINGTTGIAGANGSASTPAVQGEDTNTGVFFPAADTIAFAEGGAEVARLDSSGNFGLGTTSPATYGRLVAVSPDNTSTTQVITAISNNLGQSVSMTFAGFRANAGAGIGFAVNGSTTNAASIDSSGNLLVGTTTPAQTISTNNVLTLKAPGVAAVWGVGPTSSFGSFYVSTSGTGVSLASGATSWGTVSDERQKDIIEPIADAVSKVLSLRSVIGKYKADADGTRRSFLIAQDVQAALPEAIDVGEDEANTLSVKYTEVIPLLVAAIKELTARIAALEAAQ
jgi:hypothetical protein